MIHVQHDSLSSIAHSVIASGTTAVVLSPDKTTQILSMIIQLVAIIAMFIGKKKQV